MRRSVWIVTVFGLFGIFLFLYLTFREKPVVVPVVIVPVKQGPVHTVIGTSVEGRDIDAYAYGTGKTHLAFIGGVHGGYEWNSVLVAYEFKDYLDAHPEVVPENMTVTVIPSANPDGLYKIVGKAGRFKASDIPKDVSAAPGRFNAHTVDLNRNFDCKWQPKSTWQSKVVSGGTAAFSEPESASIEKFVLDNNPVAAVFWHSQSGAVYASRCEKGTLPETVTIMNLFAKASGYKAVETFDAYQTSGDAEGWMAKIGIPAITVELTTHDDVEFDKNLAGAKALLQYYKTK